MNLPFHSFARLLFIIHQKESMTIEAAERLRIDTAGERKSKGAGRVSAGSIRVELSRAQEAWGLKRASLEKAILLG